MSETGVKDAQLKTLLERLKSRNPTDRISLAKENPGPGELTISELASFDPGWTTESDFASAALIIAMTNDGSWPKQTFIYNLAETDPEDEGSHADADIRRAAATVERMLEAGLLEIRNNRVYSNTDLLRR